MSREAVLSSIRRSLAVSGQELLRRATVTGRLRDAPKGVIPARGQGDRAARLAMFREMTIVAQASLAEVAAAAEVPMAVAAFLRDHNLPTTLRRGDDAILAAMPWGTTALTLGVGPSTGDDLNAVSRAIAGVAETATLVLASGPDNPTTLNFLPDNHIVVIAADDIVSDYEAMWMLLRGRYGKAIMPRTVNWVTGPSRSADIEQTLLLGAHGPRRLHIVLVGA